MTFSDETLLAYLNGNLDETDAQEIESAVEADPELEQRLMALDPFAPVVRGVFEKLPSETNKIYVTLLLLLLYLKLQTN